MFELKLLSIVGLSAVLCAACANSGSGPGIFDAAFMVGPYPVMTGEEKVMCSFVRLDNEKAVDVKRLLVKQSEGSHHLVVYALDHPIDSAPVRCSQGQAGQPSWAELFVTPLHEEELTMPAGVGLHLSPHQQLAIESHLINAGSHGVEVQGSVELEYAQEGTVQERAQTYFFGSSNIDIGPNSNFTSGSTCTPPDDIHLMRMFGHEHRLGTGVRVDVGLKGGGLSEYYTSTDWASPPVKLMDFIVGPAHDVHVTCDWNNSTPDHIFYPDEMCFASGLYWPSRGQLVCVSGGLKDACNCFYSGNVENGPGGSQVAFRVGIKSGIAGVKGQTNMGHPIYCNLFHSTDWNMSGPKAGALPAYNVNVEGVVLATEADRAEMLLRDVTPGEYGAFCFMDTIGGGFMPGTGVPASFDTILAKQGETTTIDLMATIAVP